MIKPKEIVFTPGPRLGITKLVALGISLAAIALLSGHVFAFDHNDAPGTMADNPADISDFYAWNTEDGTIVAIVNFAGLAEAGSDPVYDPDVLYGIHIDNDGDHKPDIDIWARFGKNAAGDWGLQVINLPGADATAEPDICGEPPDSGDNGDGDGDQSLVAHCGPVDTVIDTGAGTRIWAGPREDPFFFDLDGYLDTVMSGTLSFDSTNDSFAGLNVTSIVVEMDAAAAADGADNIQMWATSSRL